MRSINSGSGSGRKAVLAATLFATCLLPLPAQSFFEDFSGGAGLWTVNQNATLVASGGSDGGAYLEGSRPLYYPVYLPLAGSEAAHALLGDLEARYGPVIRISYFGRTFQSDGIAGPAGHMFWTNTGPSGAPTFWRRNVNEGIGTWAFTSFLVSTLWTDAQAVQEGWVRIYGSDSFADTLRHAVHNAPYYGHCPAPCASSITHVTGIDQLSISADALVVDGMQRGGPGAPFILYDLNLVPGGEYFNIVSFEGCPQGVGSGPYLGLCASDPQLLIDQFLLPLGAIPFHFTASASFMSFGPFPLPPLAFDIVSFRIQGGFPTAVSPVVHIDIH